MLLHNLPKLLIQVYLKKTDQLTTLIWNHDEVVQNTC